MTAFPIDPTTKRPDVAWGDLTSDVPIPPGRGTGLATGARSGFLVVDLDVKRGDDGPANFAALGPCPDTFTVSTPSGGKHLYFAHVPGARNSAGKIALGVDIRAEGGYVVAPPTPGYEVVRDGEAASAPAWLVALLTRTAPAPSASPWSGMAGLVSSGGPIIEGRRNDALARLAGVMRRRGLEPEAIAAALQVHNETHCDPPLPPEEVDLIAVSMGRYVPEAPEEGSRARTPLISAPHTSAAAPSERQIEFSAADIAAPIAKADFIVESLDFCAGAPLMIAGYGYSGKTLAAQALALGLARPAPAIGVRTVWGELFRARTRPCRVVHVDWEQGPNLTRRRYQRLARGMGIANLATLPLTLVSLPDWYLDRPEAFEALAGILTNYDVAIFDSLRALAPGIDENSSEMRAPLDGLMRVSAATDCACVVIHHAKKPSKDGIGGVKMSIRGSGAIFDACGSVLVFDGEKDKPKRVSHEKARESGVTCDDFTLAVEDHAGGIRVIAEGRVKQSSEEIKTLALAETQARILECVAADAYTSVTRLRETLGGNAAHIGNAWRDLVDRGVIINLGQPKIPRWALA